MIATGTATTTAPPMNVSDIATRATTNALTTVVNPHISRKVPA
jgi:hypothetical protein